MVTEIALGVIVLFTGANIVLQLMTRRQYYLTRRQYYETIEFLYRRLDALERQLIRMGHGERGE